MASLDDIWLPLVDEPIGGIVARLEGEEPDLARLVDSPRRLLAFRTFAYIRVGIVLGQLLVDHDIDPYDGSETWVEKLLRDPVHHERVVEEVRAVANEIAADPSYADEEPLAPDAEARERVHSVLKKRLESL